eukprot:923985-Alexandrium_andersonii.AAC.1
MSALNLRLSALFCAFRRFQPQAERAPKSTEKHAEGRRKTADNCIVQLSADKRVLTPFWMSGVGR